MHIDDIVWLPDIVEKLAAKHDVSQEGVEDLFFHRPRFRYVEAGHRPGEDAYPGAGQTDAGRCLIVFSVHKGGNIALIVSDREMDRRERRRNERM